LASRTTYETTVTKQTLNRVTAPSMPFAWSINPYRGCAHGCSFCYARKFQSFLGRGADDQFQRHIVVKANAAEALEAQLSRLLRKYGGDREALGRHIGEVAIGTATDPYQPVESRARLTRECLKVLAKYRVPTSITTRSPLILRDLDIIAEMNVKQVNVSINTLRGDLVRKLEPASPLPAKRLEVVAELSARGVRAGIFAAPVLPCLTDSASDLEALFRAAKAHDASFAHASLLRLSRDVKPWFMRVLEQHFPHLRNAYTRLYAGENACEAYARPKRKMIEALLKKYGFIHEKPAASNAPESFPPNRPLTGQPSGIQRDSRDRTDSPERSAPVPEQLAFRFDET
jgi:DNA repair photolyase